MVVNGRRSSRGRCRVVGRNGPARRRPHLAVHRVAIIAQALELGLHTGDHLRRFEIVVAVNRLVIRVGVISGIVPIGRKQYRCPRSIPGAEEREPAVTASTTNRR